jgi:hypothetical protein
LNEVAHPQLLSAWESFYVIVGSSGAALVGLQFVVITLVADLRRHMIDADSVSAFATPTVVHLGGALVVSAVMSAPWPSLLPVSLALAVCSLGGLGYGVRVIHRARRQTSYRPVGEDWLWYVFLPFVLYAALMLAAFFLRRSTEAALFAIGAVALGLLLVGIHNAWDTVAYVVLEAKREAPKGETSRQK